MRKAPRFMSLKSHLASAVFVVAIASIPGFATALPITTTESDDYLLIGLGPVNDTEPTDPPQSTVGIGDATATSNFELGANKAPVPVPSSYGPGLDGNVPALPGGVQAVPTGITGDGNIAITNDDGTFQMTNTGLYADIGVRCAQSAADCDSGTSNSFFNDPNQYPNEPDGTLVNENDADQSTRIDQPTGAGVTGDYDFSALLTELDAAKTDISAATATSVWDLTSSGEIADVGTMTGTSSLSTDSGPDGKLVVTVTLADGLNVIDIDTSGQDLKLDNISLVIDGSENSTAIFRIDTFDPIKFLLTNSNILAGDGLGDLNSILWYTGAADTNQHFSFNQVIVNGIAFWSLGMGGGEIVMNDVQGCTQLVADKITLNNVRLSRCAYSPTSFTPTDMTSVPEPASFAVFSMGLLALGYLGRRRLRSAS